MQRRLKAEDIVRFDEGIQSIYPQWILGDIPDRPKEFLSNRRFAVITCRYGQNQAILAAAEHQHIQQSDWDKARCWSDLKYVSFAIATDIRYVLIRSSPSLPPPPFCSRTSFVPLNCLSMHLHSFLSRLHALL